jgi:WD40 repeat protein
MKRTGYKSSWQAGLFLAACIWLAGCNLPVTPRGGGPTDTPTLPPEAGPTITPATYGVTPTYPCPEATQELPPQVDPLTSSTDQLSQVVHIQFGNYDEAEVETESGAFTAAFNGSEGARVDVKLLPNTIHHLKVTVQVHLSNYGGCSYGGYSMTVFTDLQGQPLVIIQGKPAAPAPVTQPFGPGDFDRLKLLSRISLTDPQRAWSAIFTTDDILLTFGLGQGVRRWQAPAGQPAGELMANGESMTTVAALSADGAWLATGSGGSDAADENQTSVRLWDLKTGQARLLGHQPSTVESLAFSPGSTLLASGGNDNTVLIWDVASGEQVAKFEGDVAQLADGSSLIQGMRQLYWADDATVIARGDAVIYSWKVPTGERLLELGGEYQNMDFYQPAGLLAVVREDGVYLRDSASGRLLPMTEGGENSRGYQQVAISPEGKVLAALNQQKITFWYTDTHTMVASGKNPAGAALPLVFSPDWRYLAQVNWDDHTVSLWGVQP